MIREYAVDPTSLSRLGPMWVLMQQFGVPHGRVISRFPKKWQREVREQAIKAGCPDVELKGITDRLNHLKSAVVKPCRPRTYKGESWIEAAIAAHAEEEFAAILSESPADVCEAVIDVYQATEDCHRWRTESGVVVPRTADAIAAALAPLGKLSKDFLFVDPYLSGDSAKIGVVMKTLLESGYGSRPLRRVQLHVSDKAGALELFQRKLEAQLGKLPTADSFIEVFQWAMKLQGEKMHPRYLLTEIGGIRVEAGFESRDPGETVELQLLDRGTYETRWNQFQEGSDTYESLGSFVLEAA